MCLSIPNEVQHNLTTILAGTKLNVAINKKKPVMAFLKTGNGKSIIEVPTISLHSYFPDQFVQVTDAMIEEAILDVKCVSVAGEIVEPDGYDQNGFPSILLAKGLI